MATLTPVDPATATGQTKELFDSIQSRLHRVPNMIRLMGNSPAMLRWYLSFNEAFEHTKISPKLRGLMGALVSDLNGCTYTLAVTYALGTREGIAASEFDSARQFQADDPKTAVALRFAARIVAMSGHVPPAEVERMRAAGYTDEEIVEIVGVVVLSVFRNYFNLVAGSEVDFPVIR